MRREGEPTAERLLPEGITVLRDRWMPEGLPVSLLEIFPTLVEKIETGDATFTENDLIVIQEYPETLQRLAREWTQLLQTLCPDRTIFGAEFAASREPTASIQVWHHDGENNWKIYGQAHLAVWSNGAPTELLHLATNQVIKPPRQSVFTFDNSLYKHRQPQKISPNRFLARAAILPRSSS